MEVVYTDKAEDDLNYWRKTGNTKLQAKISSLINSIEMSPFLGIGKPEALKYELAGKWSRRINREHRIVYEVKSEFVIIHSLKGHY